MEQAGATAQDSAQIAELQKLFYKDAARDASTTSRRPRWPWRTWAKGVRGASD